MAGGAPETIAATLVQTGYGERAGQAPRSLDITDPLGVVVAGGQKHALAAAHLVKFRADSRGADIAQPMPTITSGAGATRPAGCAHALGMVTAFLEQANGGYYDGDGRDLRDPMPTVLAGASRFGVIECTLSPEAEAGALRVAAFLTTYYGNGQAMDPRDPLATITTRDRLALVTVSIRGTPYVIVDIGLRMLQPHELYAAQGFPPDYVITHGHDGRAFTKSAQVRMVGNSVSPPPAAALVAANVPEMAVRRAAA